MTYHPYRFPVDVPLPYVEEVEIHRCLECSDAGISDDPVTVDVDSRTCPHGHRVPADEIDEALREEARREEVYR